MAGHKYTIPTKVTFTKMDGAEGEHFLAAVFDWTSPATGKVYNGSMVYILEKQNGDLFEFYKESIGVMDNVGKVRREVAEQMARVLRHEIGVQSDFEIAKANFEDKIASTSYNFDIYIDLGWDVQPGIPPAQ